MKITKTQLKQIIKEEISKVLNEVEVDPMVRMYTPEAPAEPAPGSITPRGLAGKKKHIEGIEEKIKNLKVELRNIFNLHMYSHPDEKTAQRYAAQEEALEGKVEALQKQLRQLQGKGEEGAFRPEYSPGKGVPQLEEIIKEELELVMENELDLEKLFSTMGCAALTHPDLKRGLAKLKPERKVWFTENVVARWKEKCR